MKQQEIVKRIAHFVKYHNGFIIILSLVFVFGASVFASSDIRGAVLGKAIVTSEGTDNSGLLSVDLNNFNPAMTITGVSEDNLNYYVDYQFKTFGVENNIWQPLSRQLQLTVSKDALAGRDLGLYVQKELSEITDHELAFLKEAQKNEKNKGKTEIVQTTEYTGLIGLVLDFKDRILQNYEPVVNAPEIVVQPESASVCQPNWNCSAWSPFTSSVMANQQFTQTRTCNDLNNCGISDGRPAEQQTSMGIFVPPVQQPSLTPVETPPVENPTLQSDSGQATTTDSTGSPQAEEIIPPVENPTTTEEVIPPVENSTTTEEVIPPVEEPLAQESATTTE